MDAIKIELTVADQRKIVECEVRGPCFRMWLTPAELAATRANACDWTTYELSDGRGALWRPESDLDRLRKRGEIMLVNHINSRRLDDGVT